MLHCCAKSRQCHRDQGVLIVETTGDQASVQCITKLRSMTTLLAAGRQGTTGPITLEELKPLIGMWYASRLSSLEVTATKLQIA